MPGGGSELQEPLPGAIPQQWKLTHDSVAGQASVTTEDRMGTRLAILTLVGLVGWAPLIHAADEPDELMPGKVAVIKPGKLAKFVAKPAPDTTFDLPDATNDPTTEGGQLAIFDTSPVGPAENTYALPAAGWTAITGGKGYKYK